LAFVFWVGRFAGWVVVIGGLVGRFARWGRWGARRPGQQQDSGTRTARGDWDELGVKGAVPKGFLRPAADRDAFWGRNNSEGEEGENWVAICVRFGRLRNGDGQPGGLCEV
jgi:hypothetical protein